MHFGSAFYPDAFYFLFFNKHVIASKSYFHKQLQAKQNQRIFVAELNLNQILRFIWAFSPNL